MQHHWEPPDRLPDSRTISPIGVAPSTHDPLQRTMYYLGIDAHKDDSCVAVLDSDGEVVKEARDYSQEFRTTDSVHETGN